MIKAIDNRSTLAEKFCHICHWTYEVWITYRIVFDDNDEAERLQRGRNGPFLKQLNTVLQEYVLQQIAKLHDPAEAKGSFNLGIPYMIDHLEWDTETKTLLQQYRVQLESFANCIKSSRNKILSHHDLTTFIVDEPLGDFPQDADVKYFETLQKLVNLIHDKALGGPFPFASFPITDAEIFVDTLVRDTKYSR